MQAARCNEPGQFPALVLDDIPPPAPGPGELLIRVCAAGVTFAELSWYPSTHLANGSARTHAIPCHEFSGVVAALGHAASSTRIGTNVFGMNDWYSPGALAEFCLAPACAVVPKPAKLTHPQAASVPIGALTAWQGLFDRARLQPGETVLIHGGAGAVGLFAVQLARQHGAHVIATASARNADFVKELGASQVIDYHQTRFEAVLNGLDVVFDTVGGDTLERSWPLLGPGGRLVTVASTAEQSGDPRVKRAFLLVEPNPEQLLTIAGLLETGKIQTVVDSVFPLAQAPDVFSGRLARTGRGKTVISVP